MQLIDATPYSARKITFALEDAFRKDRNKTNLLQCQNTCFKLFPIHRAGWSDDANRVSSLQN